MSFVNYISYTRAVSARIKPTQNTLPIFKGSSLNRKKDASKKTLASSLPGEVCTDVNENEKRKQASNSLRSHSSGKRSVNKSGADRSHTGHRKERKFSSRSRNKSREKTFALYDASPADFTFLTLTMIGDCTDRLAQKCLNKFLTVLRSKHGLFNYVWIAERQMKTTGRIHFHFILDKRFAIRSINKLWVLQQYNAGITHPKYSYEQITQAYENDSVHKLLNPVDVRTVRNRNALSGYLTMYITKNNESFTCAVWHCSRGISCLFTGALINNSDFAETGSEKNFYVSKKGKKYVNKTFVVTDKITGKTLAVINHIFNRDYYCAKHFDVLRKVNGWMLDNINARQVKRGEDLLNRFGFGFDDFNLDACEWLN